MPTQEELIAQYQEELLTLRRVLRRLASIQRMYNQSNIPLSVSGAIAQCNARRQMIETALRNLFLS